VAKRLMGCAREVDTVSRLAGDEFSIILDELESEDEAGIVANRVLTALTEPFHHKSNELFSSVSIGIAIYPINGETADDILKSADMAMYHVKELGKNNFYYFNDSLNEKALKRRELETGLRAAINDNKLVVYYQPKVDLKSGKIASMEALARWPKNDDEVISPADFIPIAESTGLIVLLDELILQKSCSFLKKVQNTHSNSITVSVNLSTKGLENLNLTQNILKTVCKFGLDPKHVELEVTESMIIRNVESAIEILRDFREKGFDISVDDFGTGYSSLSYLAKFPISTLKIDKAFVNGLASDLNSQSIARAIISMAHAMGMKVVAEGVNNSMKTTQLGVLIITHYQRILNFIKPNFVHIVVDGKIVGGLGISGGTSEQDGQCCQAAIAALEAASR